MERIEISVSGNTATVAKQCPVVAGTVGLSVGFVFDEVWSGLSKTGVFRANGKTMDCVNITDTAVVPWELLKTPGCRLWAGVYGTNADGNLQIPTLWADLGVIQPGADPTGDVSADPTLPVWEQNVSYKLQEKSEKEKAQARQNIGAAEQTEYGLCVYSKYSGAGVLLEPQNETDESGYIKNIYLRLLGAFGDERVRLGGLASGTEDSDGATVAQLRELAESFPVQYMPAGIYCLSQMTSGIYYFGNGARYTLLPEEIGSNAGDHSLIIINRHNGYITDVIEFSTIQGTKPALSVITVDLRDAQNPELYQKRKYLKDLFSLFDRVRDAETALGDTETALDSILAIQEHLMGGNGQ